MEVLCLQSILTTQSISRVSNLRKRIRIRMNLITEKSPSLGAEYNKNKGKKDISFIFGLL